MNKSKYLPQISGIKVIAMLMIFGEHIGLSTLNVALGGWAVSIFFLLSGFLYHYTHKFKPIAPTFKNSLLFIQRKMVSFYPLHLLGFILALQFYKYSTFANDLTKAIINLLLIQSWSNQPEIYFSYNGVSWFLSSLIFCLFMAPFLARLLRTSRGTLKAKKVIFATNAWTSGICPALTRKIVPCT